MQKVRDKVSAALQKAAADMKKHYDKRRRTGTEYKVGDKVWLEGTNLSTDRPMAKLGDKRFGPFKVVEKIGSSSYKLELPKTWKSLHPIFNELLRIPYHEPEFPTHPRNTRPPPIVIGKEPEYEGEKIVNSRIFRRKLQYKVQWKGYGAHEQTWEPPSNLTNAKEAIAEFHNQYPDKPRPMTLRRIEIPISLFDTTLFRPMPTPNTEPTADNLPSEALTHKLARVWKRSS